MNSEVKPQKKQRSKSKINLSVKTKVMVGVYFALVVLIIAMLLINAIPAVSAQDTSAASASHEIVNEQEANRTADKIQNESGLVKGDGYTYDTQTNWFEKFCDSISNIFG